MIICKHCKKKFKRIKFLLQHLTNGAVKGKVDYAFADSRIYQESVSRLFIYKPLDVLMFQLKRGLKGREVRI